MKINEIEIWKDVLGYEGLYQVSNLGNVKSLNYNHTKKTKLLKLSKDTHGYYIVPLCKNKKRRNMLVHRLVAIAFIPNPNNYPCVNHKKEFEINNNAVENLEWCTIAYNNMYGTHSKRVTESRKWYRHSEETKEKIRQKAIGRKHSKATRIKMSNTRKLIIESEVI